MGDLLCVAALFGHGGIIDVREFGSGNINNTFLVTSRGKRHFILQRINRTVFCRPELVMHNMRVATDHLRRRLESSPLPRGRRWVVPRVLLTDDGKDHWTGPDGSFWRAVSFIEDSMSFDTIRGSDHAEEVGYALGMFHNLLSDLPAEGLADTLEGFHITPRYLRHYDEVVAKRGASESPEMKYCSRFVSERTALAHVLEDARTRGALPIRVIHGDPKVNNILLDASTGKAVSVVDLDTVKPGLIHYDIGDCLRSACNPQGENAEDGETVKFDADLFRAVLRGYVATARASLTENDFSYLYDCVRLIAFELGLRFFTDYLEGDIYFKVRKPEHNLARALVQFGLTRSIEEQEKTLRKIIADIR